MGSDVVALNHADWSQIGTNAGAIVAYAALGLALLVIGFYAVDLATPGRLSTIIRDERNINATVLAACGVFGVSLIVVAAIFASGGRLADGLISTAIYGLIGVVAQVVAAFVFNVLVRIDVRGLVHEEQVSPAAVLLGVTHIAIGMVTAIAII